MGTSGPARSPQVSNPAIILFGTRRVVFLNKSLISANNPTLQLLAIHTSNQVIHIRQLSYHTSPNYFPLSRNSTQNALNSVITFFPQPHQKAKPFSTVITGSGSSVPSGSYLAKLPGGEFHTFFSPRTISYSVVCDSIQRIGPEHQHQHIRHSGR